MLHPFLFLLYKNYSNINISMSLNKITHILCIEKGGKYMITLEFTYVVQPGDTLFLIAKKYNTSVNAIIMRNNIVNPSLIYPGQILIIPVQGIYYTVQPGDTVYLIGQKFGIPYESIIYANSLVYPYTIYPGQTLFIPGAKERTQQFPQYYYVNPNLIYSGQISSYPSAPPVEYPTLKSGDTGPFVVDLQSRLKSLGFDPGTIDGIFSQKTETQVKDYQKSRGLPSTGVVDSATWNALLFGTQPVIGPTPDGIVYIVKPGDTLWNIAKMYNTTVDAIVKVNPDIKDTRLIYPGHRIIIPPASTSQSTSAAQEEEDKKTDESK